MHRFISLIITTLIILTACSGSKSTDAIEPLTYDTFIEKVWDFKSHPDECVYIGRKPCVIMFVSPTSEPCQNMKPIFEALQEEHKDKVVFYSVDVEAEQALGNSFKVDVVPTVMLFPKEGQPTIVQGLRSQADYEKLVNQLFS